MAREKGLAKPNFGKFFFICKMNYITVQEGVILSGDWVVIPKSLRKDILADLHTAHQEVQSTLRKARENIYWANMNCDIKEHISRCENCTTYTS